MIPFESSKQDERIARSGDQAARIATLTADLEQEKEAHRVTLQVMQNAIQERDAARRDIGQARNDALEEAAKVCERLAMQIETETIVCDWDGPDALDEAAKDIRKLAPTPTADPRDAVVSAARELAQGVREFAEDPDDLILLCNLESELAKLDAAATPARETFADRIAKANDAREAGRIMRDPARRGDSGGA